MTYAETINRDCRECDATVRFFDTYCWNCGCEDPGIDEDELELSYAQSDTQEFGVLD